MAQTTIAEQAVMEGIHGIAQAIKSELHKINEWPTECHPLSDKVFKDVETLAQSLALLAGRAKTFHGDK